MTIKDAILESLKDFPQGGIAKDIYQNIVSKKYFEFNKNAKTPYATVQALLGDFIRNNDPRVCRIINSDNIYEYCLTEYCSQNVQVSKSEKATKPTYTERDLHPLLSTFLKRKKGIISKTIFHEHSNKNEEHQKWVHPDIVGVEFIEYEDNVCQSFFKATNRNDTLKIHSYELKKEITTDYELKKCFFQAVSNSSWANYSYLVAFKISDNLLEELERLNNSFGIGFIQLNSNPEKSRIMFSPKDKQLDFKTIERLCNINPDFKVFIKQIEKIITASDKYVYDVKKGLIDICDKTFETEAEALNYCKYKNII